MTIIEFRKQIKKLGYKKVIENGTKQLYIKGVNGINIYKNSNMIETIINNNSKYFADAEKALEELCK